MRELVKNFKNVRTLKLIIGVLLVISIAGTQPANALTDYLFFSVNGDTTGSTFVQGDTVGWGGNCDVGSMMYWEIWYDSDDDSTINSEIDMMITSFIVTDGDTTSDGPEGDISPIPDGYYQSPPFILGIGAGQYLFYAMNLTDSTSVTRAFICNAMPSPPNQFTGWVTIPGHPAPDSQLLNIWVEAEPDGDEGQIWSAFTNDSGYFEINVGSVGTGLDFYVRPGDVSGFVAPEGEFLNASGVTDSIMFDYGMPIDSVFGVVKDDVGELITPVSWIYCEPQFMGATEKNTQTDGGHYVIYFGTGEEGDWEMGINSDNLIPDYLVPGQHYFSNDTADGIELDFVAYRADTVLYIKVTENGGLPANNYQLQLYSESLGSYTYSVSGTGSDNITEMHISSLDPSGWDAGVSTWDDQYPIPAGFVLDGSPLSDYGPGDTISINFINGHMVVDTLKLDPEDTPLDWTEVWVNMYSSHDKYTGATAGPNGVFTIYADTGTYTLSVHFDNYLVTPDYRTVEVTGDTTGDLGFMLNHTHCRVSGTMNNIILPVHGVYLYASTGSSIDGYQAWADVDSSTGNFEFYLCDGDWTINPPDMIDRIKPGPASFTIGEIPDTAQTVDLEYSIISAIDDDLAAGLPIEFELKQNLPNPFNPVTTIGYNLPSKAQVKIEVFNLLGQKVVTLLDGSKPAGTYQVTWDGTNNSGVAVSTGIYFYVMRADNFNETRKMVLLK